MSANRMVAGYARVSSEQQAKSGTIDSQIASLRERIAADGEQIGEEMLFIDAGVSGVYPCEVGPMNLNVGEIRKEYPRLLLLGNIDKIALVKGKDAIEKEIDSKVPYMKKEGGYIPAVDHHVSPDTPLENFLYYLEYLKRNL